eukprot:GFUD01121092.1.p1 GENE.GFUD01121092.1~~GFUD01121092.1.p1  ORF type:complete len:351 (-),score=71.20 GFUD01121092.1:117-1169(-)
MMARHLAPVSDQPSSVNYHQKVAWKITEEFWNLDENLDLGLGTKIPGSWDGPVKAGGLFRLFPGKQRRIVFATYWPTEVNEENIEIETIFRMKKGSEDRFVVKVSDSTLRSRIDLDYNLIMSKLTTLHNPSELDLYDEKKAFILEAEIIILKKNPECFDSINAPCKFLKDMQSIMKLEEISDLVIVCSGKVIKCHKTILCARSAVFKNMLSGDTLENLNREVPINDSSVEAVEEMLKYIYTGEIPDKIDELNVELLYLAEKYQLDPLKFACGGSIVSSLTISTCISSFVTVERHFPPDSLVRENIDQFLRCNAAQVIESEAWDELVEKFPKLSRDLVRAMVGQVREGKGH